MFINCSTVSVPSRKPYRGAAVIPWFGPTLEDTEWEVQRQSILSSGHGLRHGCRVRASRRNEPASPDSLPLSITDGRVRAREKRSSETQTGPDDDDRKLPRDTHAHIRLSRHLSSLVYRPERWHDSRRNFWVAQSRADIHRHHTVCPA